MKSVTSFQHLHGLILHSYFSLLFILLLPLASSLSFNFTTFDHGAQQGLVYQGVAAVAGGVIHLTTNQSDAVGKAVYFEPVPIWDSASGAVTDFTTRFSFVMDGFNQSISGDGLTFFLQPFPTDIPFDSYGGTLGLFNGTADNITPNRIVAVEFDSFLNSKYNDTSSDHVGIDVHTIFSVARVDLETSIKQGLVANARVSYNSSTKNLSVSLAYAPNPVVNGSWTLSHVVDLKEMLPEEAAVGFSAATGNAVEAHSILSWEFSSTLEAGKKMITKKRKMKGLTLGCVAGAITCLCLLGLLWFVCSYYCRKKKDGREKKDEDIDLDVYVHNALIENGGGPKKFSYRELVKATRNFSEERKLGKGGFGEVYKGVLSHSKLEVAIKRVSRGSKQGKKEYLSEIKIISRLRHRNLVQLIGYCHDNENLLLVYEFMSNGSLDTHLYGESKFLPWPQRCKIVTGIASALLYLHEEWEQCIVHRDLKPSNVMLDSGLNVKLGDFGLARLLDHDQRSLTTVLAGTRGYMAPEYATSGKACKESDVYSFGVVALEVVCGRKPFEYKEEMGTVNLVEWVWELHGRGECLAAADERLQMDFDEKHMEKLMVVGLWCAHPDCGMRPTIRQAINALNFESPLPNLPPKMPVPKYLPPSSDGSYFEQSSSSGCSVMTNSAINGR